MNFKYFRIMLFEKLLGPFQKRQRGLRMKTCVTKMGLDKRKTILDLGGLPGIWDTVETSHDITFLNLPGVPYFTDPTHHNARHIEGDACCVDEFEDKTFEVVFSNSVIEHVGSEEKIRQFADEVRRLSKSFWIQTPSKFFPVEAHCGMPFWWFYPTKLQQYFISRWRRKLPAWTEMVEGTTVLTKAQLIELFPEAKIHVERVCGIPKSYTAYFINSSAH